MAAAEAACIRPFAGNPRCRACAVSVVQIGKGWCLVGDLPLGAKELYCWAITSKGSRKRGVGRSRRPAPEVVWWGSHPPVARTGTLGRTRTVPVVPVKGTHTGQGTLIESPHPSGGVRVTQAVQGCRTLVGGEFVRVSEVWSLAVAIRIGGDCVRLAWLLRWLAVLTGFCGAERQSLC